jgi:hypothetical protein
LLFAGLPPILADRRAVDAVDDFAFDDTDEPTLCEWTFAPVASFTVGLVVEHRYLQIK